MTYRLRFRGPARADVRRARNWYEREAPHMADPFLEELSAVVSSIEDNPLMYPKILGEVRRALMTRFAYAIYFTLDEGTIVVFAVTHQSRDEDKWRRRVPLGNR